MSSNPILRALLVVVLVACGIRLTIALIEPVWPYLLAALIVFTLFRLARWNRGRW